MSLYQQITDDLTRAMYNKDALKVSVFRQLKTALNNEAIAKKKKDEGLTDDEAFIVIKREANRRKDAINAYTQAKRYEQVEQEKAELDIIWQFLPEQFPEDEIRKIVDEVIVEIGEVDQNKFGQVMGLSMKKLGSQADGSLVSRIVREKIQRDL